MLVKKFLVSRQVWGATRFLFQFMEIKICSLFPAGSGQTLCGPTHTHLERIHTSLGWFPVGIKMSIHYTASLSLSLYVCVLAKSPQPVRENTFELLHKGRVWFGLDNNVPCLTDPEFNAGSSSDVTESVHKTGWTYWCWNRPYLFDRFWLLYQNPFLLSCYKTLKYFWWQIMKLGRNPIDVIWGN